MDFAIEVVLNFHLIFVQSHSGAEKSNLWPVFTLNNSHKNKIGNQYLLMKVAASQGHMVIFKKNFPGGFWQVKPTGEARFI